MRVPEINPPLCSACFISKIDQKFVDFEVFWDGPVVPLEGKHDERFAKPSVAIDDLFICEDCMKQAAGLIGLGDVEEAVAELEGLRAEVLELRRERLESNKRLEAVSGALEGRKAVPKPESKPKTPARKATAKNA